MWAFTGSVAFGAGTWFEDLRFAKCTWNRDLCDVRAVVRVHGRVESSDVSYCFSVGDFGGAQLLCVRDVHDVLHEAVNNEMQEKCVWLYCSALVEPYRKSMTCISSYVRPGYKAVE